MLRVTTDPLLALQSLSVLEREIGRVMQFAATDARAHVLPELTLPKRFK